MIDRGRNPFAFCYLAAIGTAAIALSGCVTIENHSSTQLEEIGGVQISTTAGADPPAPGTVQLLLAYRIPTSAAAPSAIATTTSSAGIFTFDQSPSFISELETKAAAPSGQKWVGYLSSAQSHGAGHQSYAVAPQFGLQRGPDGSPFQGPFLYRTVVGFRSVDGTHPASRPVSCGDPITSGSDGTSCATDPSSMATIATNLQQATQDLGILDDLGPQSVDQGKIARFNFNAMYSGHGDPAPTFTVGTATNVPGAVAVPSTPVLIPQEGSTPLRAIFRVPVDTPLGSYDVTMIASLPNGQVRSNTRELLVTPTAVRCDRSAPTIAGTRKDDVLKGTNGRDVITGYRGDDVIMGLRGNDLICAGRGDDTLRGGDGNDQIAGRRGNDLLLGGRGRNVIRPGPGKDRFIQ